MSASARHAPWRARILDSRENVGAATMPIDTTEDAHLATDSGGIIQSCNAAAEQLFGYSAAEMVGRPVRILIPPELQAEEDDILARLRLGERIEAFETARLSKNGARRDVSLTVSAVRDESGAIVGMSRIARDITARKRAAAQAYLAAIIESSDDAIISKDLNGIIQSCNASAQRMFGYTAGELVGRSVRILIPADRQQEEDDILARLRRGERIDHFETIRVRKDGRPLDISLTVSPVRDASGAIVGVSKVARDITEQKRAAAELAAQQEWFRVTLGSIGDGVIASNPEGRVTYMNATAEAMTGWTRDEALGRSLDEVFHIVHQDSRRPVDNPATAALRTGTVVPLANHTILVGRDGTEHAVDDSAAPIRDAKGGIIGVVLVFRDVTAQRRSEADRRAAALERDRLLAAERAARAEAERASRVKDEFVAMVSHELRTPLNAILGWTQLMMRDAADTALVERGLDIVARNTRLQAQLISDLLDVSRIVAGKLQLEMQPVDLASIIGHAIEAVEHDAVARSLTVVRDLDAPAHVTADPARLQQVVWNLLANAIKFTPAGGTITVRLRRREDEAEIVVSDTGTGISAEVLPHVFDRFHQADNSITRQFGGLGLGLSIVKHLVERHGGSVSAASEGQGHGASFSIRLPAAAAAATDPGEPAAVPDRQEATTLAGLRILVVEDDRDTQEFLVRLLEGHGASVMRAVSAAQALALLAASEVDLLVSDIGLPGMDGYDLIQQVRAQAADSVPAIALTAYARTEDRIRALAAGYQAHVAKPVEPQQLLTTAARVARRSPVPRGTR